jgi:translation initiation factor 2B subunit (eIF-2B alpha/beta/delta family)
MQIIIQQEQPQQLFESKREHLSLDYLHKLIEYTPYELVSYLAELRR